MVDGKVGYIKDLREASRTGRYPNVPVAFCMAAPPYLTAYIDLAFSDPIDGVVVMKLPSALRSIAYGMSQSGWIPLSVRCYMWRNMIRARALDGGNTFPISQGLIRGSTRGDKRENVRGRRYPMGGQGVLFQLAQNV